MLEVSIRCEGERMEEYGPQVDGNVVSCWVESRIDKVCLSCLSLLFLHLTEELLPLLR